MTHYGVIKKLLGPIHAIGDHSADQDREANLDNAIEVAHNLISEIQHAARTKDRHEASMKAIGKKASEFLYDLRESLEEEESEG